jgi:Tol biopolymer transport system component
MSLAPGTRLGPYEIVAPIGVGGMGEVYSARDTKLDRTVALKVIPADVSGDLERLSRFEREAKAVAALSHPNILAIHDFGRENGTAYSVMELLEGETLRDRLSEGALAERKAVDIAAQMARGLGAAHDKGIVHRDLKPENVFITHDGQVKVLDFGLAKVIAPATSAGATKTLQASTDPGKVMGTVGYMSPEQVQGEPADHRTDVFSFGLILYEMLTGKRAFQRDSAVETMSAILREEPPDLRESAATVPPALERVVHRCLEKKPGERFQSARDLAFALENASGTSVSGAASALPAASRIGLWRTLAPLLTFVLGILGGAALYQRLSPPAEVQPVQVRMLTFSGSDAEPTVSPDGRIVAFRSDRDGQSRIWVKQLAGGGEAPLTSGPDFSPRFSPDGSMILFLRVEGAQADVYRIALVGGDPRKVMDNAVETAWSPDGNRIAFLRGAREGTILNAVLGIAGANGDNPRELVHTAARSLRGVCWQPDGRALTAISSNPTGNSPDSLFLIDVETGKTRVVAPAGTVGPLAYPAWCRSGKILLAQAGSSVGDQSGALSRVLLYDPGSGDEQTLFWSRNLFPSLGGNGLYSRLEIVKPGVVVFNEMVTTQNLREFSLGAGGSAAGRQWAKGNSRDRQPAYSPDGREIIFSSSRSGNLDLWVLSTQTGAVRQLTDDAAQDWDPAFTPDGRSILWSSDRGGNLEIWTADVEGSGARQLTADGADAENPTATPDGWVVYWSGHPDKLGVWKIRMDGSEATQLVSGAVYGTDVSPDGRYATMLVPSPLLNVIKTVEIATREVAPFEIRVPYRVASAGIAWGRPRWLPDGRAIAFVGEDADGLSGIFAQDFDPDHDTGASRRRLAGFSPEFVSESFGIAPDGTRLTLSILSQTYNLMMAEDVPGVEPPGWGR